MRHARLALLLASITLLAIALPAGAQAATARVDPSFYKADHTGDRVVYQADPGEANELVMTWDGPALVVTDVVPIDPGPGCSAEGANQVRCSPRHYSVSVGVRLGDGDDSVRLGPGSRAGLWGGPGDDLLVGTPDQSNEFHGAAGDDTMIRGSGWDSFHEGAARSGSDTMTGGSGQPAAPDHDSVDYGRRRGAVHADVDGDRDDGERRERDLVGPDAGALCDAFPVGGREPHALARGGVPLGPPAAVSGTGERRSRPAGSAGDHGLRATGGLDRLRVRAT